MFIHYMHKYMTLSFYWIKKGENWYKFVFLIVMAPWGYTHLNLNVFYIFLKFDGSYKMRVWYY